MSKENSKRIREITAFAAALIMVGAFSLPSGTEIMGVGLGSAVVASAAEVDHGNCGDGVTWSLDSDGTLTISGTGAMNDWISKWAVPWNNYNNTIKSVVIEKGVTSIGINTFYDCTSLESITIPSGVTSIRDYAFENCSSLTGITIPDGVTYIGKGTFMGCTSLTSITIPDSVTSIRDGTFMGCTSLTSITIPSSVTSIGNYAFENCSSLTSITIPDSVTSISEGTFMVCTSLESITIPDGVTSIGRYSFNSCTSLKSIFLPKRLTSIGTDAIPAAATRIKYTVSGDNVTVTDVTAGTGQTSVAIPETIDGKTVTIGSSVDFGTLTQIRYTVSGGKVTVTGVILGYGQSSFTVPETIGGKSVAAVFFEDGTSGVTIPASATRIGYTVTDDKVTVTEVTIGEGQTSFDIPSTIGGNPVTDIADDALVNCPNVVHTHREKTAAACTEKAVCSICGQGYGEALGHDHSGDWLNDTVNHWRVCERDNCTEIIDKANHDFDKGVVTTEPTEDAEGVKTFTCKDCGYEKTESMARLDHTHKTAEEYSSDATGHWHACSGCEEKVDFEKHSFGEGVVITEPTEDAEGVRTYTCEVCGYEKTESISKLNHTHKTSEKYSMDESGHWHACFGCEEKIDFESHTEDSGTVTTEPTETTEGVKTFKCVKCGYVIRTETLPVFTKEEAINSFVERLYQNILSRGGDGHKEDHVANLENSKTACEVAYDFVFSPEFMEQPLSNEDRVKRMYLAFLGREADPEGLASWTAILDNGCSIGHIFYGFAQSREFGELCDEYGITQGTWEFTESRDKNPELTSFVSRLYTKALNRAYDVDGLNNHTANYLANGDLYQLAYDFIFSTEFTEKELSDEDFVDTMYRTFFDREGDPKGRSEWIGKLKSGMSREEVLAGFVGSQECADMVAKFGI